MKEQRLLREYIRSVLFEFVVPKGYSLSSWKAHRKKQCITNTEYAKENPGMRWKVVHGHKKGKVGEPLPGMDDMSYTAANKAHSAVAMSKG